MGPRTSINGATWRSRHRFVRLVTLIIEQAIAAEASDIHEDRTSCTGRTSRTSKK
jgi:type II secretory ATPase GspE/PulE/Tfp pilus assembly ATPase PilB-like protein